MSAVYLLARVEPSGDSAGNKRIDPAEYFELEAKGPQDSSNQTPDLKIPAAPSPAAHRSRRAAVPHQPKATNPTRQRNVVASQRTVEAPTIDTPVAIQSPPSIDSTDSSIRAEAMPILLEKTETAQPVRVVSLEEVESPVQPVVATITKEAEVTVRSASIVDTTTIHLSKASPPVRPATTKILAKVDTTRVPIDASPITQPIGKQETVEADEFAEFVFQGSDVVNDALIDPAKPGTNRGRTARDNTLKRGNSTNALLIRFDLDAISLPTTDRVHDAQLSLYNWSAQQSERVRLCAFSVGQPWDEDTVTWRRASTARKWRGGPNYAFSVGPGPASRSVILEPLATAAQAAATREIQLDVTGMVRMWLRATPNHGLSVSPVIDRNIDRGVSSELNIFASEYSVRELTPKLTLRFDR